MEKTFTLNELKEFDGKDGRPAYIAVDGVVYDATGSGLWRRGTHVRVHEAGADLSRDILLAPHPRDRLDRLPVVGRVEAPARAQVPVSEPEPIPWFAALAYKLHMHPASVHFPIALCAVASLLHSLFLVTGWAWAEPVARVNLIIGLAAAPVSVLSGILDWRYQYEGRLTSLFIWKLGLSGVLLGMGGLCLAMLLMGGESALFLYNIFLVLMAPIVLGLGFVGGRITFPA